MARGHHHGFGIGRARGWVKALDGVSVQISESETLGIVGESGSGKTTLAKLFLLLERPTAGSLLFDGTSSHAFRRRDVARYRRAVRSTSQCRSRVDSRQRTRRGSSTAI